MRLIILLFLTCLAAPLCAAEYFCLSQDGRRVGSAELRFDQDGPRRTDHERFVVFIRGARTEGDLRVETEVVRDAEGLVSVARTLHSGRVTERVQGERREAGWFWRSESGGLPPVHSEGPGLVASALATPSGGQTLDWFNPIDLETIRLVRAGDQLADVDERRVYRVEDEQLRPARMRLFELDFDLAPCSAEQASRRRATLDPLGIASIDLPVMLDEMALRGKLGFELAAVPGAPSVADSAEQRWRLRDGVLAVVVCRDCRNEPEPVADLAWSMPDVFIDSDHPAVRAEAQRLRRADPLKTMQVMTRFVKRHLWRDTDELGYASASQALASRQGNCSEHAVLLAALARAVGIPARVIHGWVYATERRPQRAMLQPHAWVQAHVGGRWQSFDAGQDLGFSAGHVALAIGPADPQDVYPELAKWRAVRVRRVVRLD